MKNNVRKEKKIEGSSPSLEGVDFAYAKDGVVQVKKKLSFPYNRKLKQTARNLRKARNLAEVLLWEQVKNKKLHGLDFDRQKIIGNYIVDFYCHSKLLIIEIDGSSHNNKIEYDNIREKYFRDLGLNVLKFSDHDVRNNLDYVLRDIMKI